MNMIPAASGTVATLVNGEKLSVIGWKFEVGKDEKGHSHALTIHGPLALRPFAILEIKHADGRTEQIK